MAIQFNPYSDWLLFVGNNGSGKTTLMKYLLQSVDKNHVYVLNCGGSKAWDSFKEQSKVPASYELEYLDKFLLQIIKNDKIKKLHLVIDDADNYDLRKSAIFKSMYINSRRLAIGGMLSVRVLTSVPLTIYNASRYLFISVQRNNYIIQYIRGTIGDDAFELRNLNQYEFMAYDMYSKSYEIIKLDKNIAKKIGE